VWWWVFFALWIGLQGYAILGWLAQEPSKEAATQLLGLSFFAAFLGIALACFTAVGWKHLPIYQRIVGLLPSLYLVAVVFLFVAGGRW
jgi:hypothetical protein